MNTNTKASILIVDDDPIITRTLTAMLTGDYQISVANDGAAALVIARSERPPDLILLDVIMPDMDGMTTCRLLKSEPLTKQIPVIFISGQNKPQDEIAGFAAGAIDYIKKPFVSVVVKARIATHIELNQQRIFLEQLSQLDGLTGVANRRKFDESIAVAVEFAVRNSFPLALVMIDIDYFKNFNDSYGHYQGDDCLVRVARALATTVSRKSDLVARYGGEEFVCVLPGVKHPDALRLAEQMRLKILALKIPHATSVVNDFVTISLGVASIETDYSDNIVERMILAADKELYRAKSQGRNQVAGIKL
ncbi:MAG: diguanylate cyclase [Bacillota bacterium]